MLPKRVCFCGDAEDAKERDERAASPSLEVEEMATAEMCQSPVSAAAKGHPFDASQKEMMERSTQEWSEQLEKEFFSVLNDLDDQLAQEQAQEPLDRTVSTSSASSVHYRPGFSTCKRQHRNAWSDLPGPFLPDGLRTIRAQEEHKLFIRPRKLHSAYLNWQQAAFPEASPRGDAADGKPPLLSRRLSALSFGRSSEGSLYPPSIAHSSGFRHRSCLSRDTAGRSYSVCSLQRCSSAVSSEQLSACSVQHPLARESSHAFVPRLGRQNPKRTPLSSIVWNNTADSPGPAQDTMLRSQSMMEFPAPEHGGYPGSFQEAKQHTCYHSRHHSRRSVSSSSCFSRVSCPDKATSPLPFDNWENYPFYTSETNLSRSYYRDTSPGKLYANKTNPYGIQDSYPSWADTPQHYTEEAFLPSDASFEVIMANLAEQQWGHTKNARFGSQLLQNDFHLYSPEKNSVKRPARTVPEFTEGCQPWHSCNSAVSSAVTRTEESGLPHVKDQAKPTGLQRDSVLVTSRSTRAGFSQLEKAEAMKLPDEDMLLQSVSQQADTNYPNAKSSPSNSPASAMLQSDGSLLDTVRSKRHSQATARGDNASKSDPRSVHMKENSCPPSSVCSQPLCVLPAEESNQEAFLPGQKEWEHHLHHAAQRESTKKHQQSAELLKQAAPKRLCSLLHTAAAAPATGKAASCQAMLSSPPERLSSSSQGSAQALCRGLGTLASSTVNCTVPESQAEGGRRAPVSRAGAANKISQKTLQSTSTLGSKDSNGQPTASSQQSISMPSFGGDPETSRHSLSYFCLEKASRRSSSPGTERPHKQDSLLRPSSSCSIPGSPSRKSLSSPDSLVIYYTLPRKSASIAGSVLSETPISLPRDRRAAYTCWRSETPCRADACCSNQRDVSCLDSKHSFLTLNAATRSKERDYPRPSDRSPSDSGGSSRAVELTDRWKQLSRRESSVFPGCKERGNLLQKYKTTSTFTVCVDEDHVKYHELVSVYYTLPRRHSRTFCHLFREKPEDADLPAPNENAQAPRTQSKENEAQGSPAKLFFPSTLEKEARSYSSDPVSSALVTPQSSGTAVDSEENPHLCSSSGEICTSKPRSVAHSREESSAGPSSAESVLSDGVTKDGPQPTTAVAKSAKATSDASSCQKTETAVKGREDISQPATPLVSTLSASAKPGRCSENPFCSTKTSILQKRNCESCCQPPEGNTNNTLSSLALCPGEKSCLGRNGDTQSAEDTHRDNPAIQQRVHFLHQTAPLYNNKWSGLHFRADSSRKKADHFNSCSKVLPESQSKASEVSVAASAGPGLQLDQVSSTETDELNPSKTRKEPNSQSTGMGKDSSGMLETERHREGNLNLNCTDKVLRVTQADQKRTQSAEEEDRLLSDCTRDKAKDLERRKNRPSIKNKLAAVYKTSRKFSSKNLPPKPHISNIFSQNDADAAAVEGNTSPDSLISGDSHQPFLQADKEKQNHTLDSDQNMPRPRTAENKTENQNDPSLLVGNTNWRSFRSSYTQEEPRGPQKPTMKVESRPSLTALFPDQAVSTRNKNCQAVALRSDSRSQPISPISPTSGLLNENRRAGSGACSPPLPLPTDTNSNTYANSCLQADPCPEHSLTSQTVLGQCQSSPQPASLTNANLQSCQWRESRARSQPERHLPEGLSAPDSSETFASGSNNLPEDGIHGKRLKSYSELVSCDENENWASEDERCYSTRNLLYPSVEFGIFGKEQQLAFLENIKRSLTEGRLWRPCLLNNPAALRDGEPLSINRAELLSSSSAGSKVSSAASSPREVPDVCREEPAAYSDSDSDTTTDDEYYLDETDKESEL